ncbi:MAG TPA: rRNA maturation RNase YbeY [Dehalococcoidales bacterium]
MEINVLIEEGVEVETDPEWLQKVVEKTLQAENAPPSVEISLVITGQARIRELNRQYRGTDQPTDVLSFSMSEQKEDEEPAPFIGPPDGLLHLGEVIISYPQAVIQAQERNHSVKKEMAILTVHGVLHILGYDHEQPDKEPAMTAKEKSILDAIEGELL